MGSPGVNQGLDPPELAVGRIPNSDSFLERSQFFAILLICTATAL